MLRPKARIPFASKAPHAGWGTNNHSVRRNVWSRRVRPRLVPRCPHAESYGVVEMTDTKTKTGILMHPIFEDIVTSGRAKNLEERNLDRPFVQDGY